jgi:hypothetical protein
LDSIETVEKSRFVLSAGIKMPGEENKTTNHRGGAQPSPSGIEALLIFHSDNAPVLLGKSYG